MNIIIVGAGVSGLLTGLYIQKKFPKWNIAVFEDKNSKTLPVGENLHQNSFKFICECLNQSKEQTAKELLTIGCSIKLGTKFIGWSDKIDEYYQLYNNPFQSKSPDGITLHDIWIYENQSSQNANSYFQDNFGSTIESLENGLIPSEVVYEHNFPSMFIDATKISDFLKSKANFKIVDCKIIDIIEEEHQYKLVNDKNETIKADYIFDCTGFKRILLSKTTKFNPIESNLTNSAIGKQTKHSEKIKSYMKVQALNQGWMFSIPLQNRLGEGYIFNSEISNEEEIKREFLNEKENNINNFPVIRWKPGIAVEPWKKNIIGIGSTSYFNEPMFGTTIEMISRCVTTIVKLLGSEDLNKREKYKEWLYVQSDLIDKKILAQYYFCPKNDNEFWKEAKFIGNKLRIEEYVEEIIYRKDIFSLYDDIIWPKSIWEYFYITIGKSVKKKLIIPDSSLMWAKDFRKTNGHNGFISAMEFYKK